HHFQIRCSCEEEQKSSECNFETLEEEEKYSVFFDVSYLMDGAKETDLEMRFELRYHLRVRKVDGKS
ncbi:hypothetical protein NPIL_243171, partial [Nephila pilipes]